MVACIETSTSHSLLYKILSFRMKCKGANFLFSEEHILLPILYSRCVWAVSHDSVTNFVNKFAINRFASLHFFLAYLWNQWNWYWIIKTECYVETNKPWLPASRPARLSASSSRERGRTFVIGLCTWFHTSRKHICKGSHFNNCHD